MTHSKRKQRGVLMLEALIGILIFSIGILALVAMQAAAVSQTTDARYRSEASLHADRLIGTIWATRANNATAIAALASSWASEVSSGSMALPNASGANAPTVDFVDATKKVTVTVYWQAPGASTRSNHVAIAYVDFNL